jgi:hypothetical protein
MLSHVNLESRHPTLRWDGAVTRKVVGDWVRILRDAYTDISQNYLFISTVTCSCCRFSSTDRLLGRTHSWSAGIHSIYPATGCTVFEYLISIDVCWCLVTSAIMLVGLKRCRISDMYPMAFTNRLTVSFSAEDRQPHLPTPSHRCYYTSVVLVYLRLVYTHKVAVAIKSWWWQWWVVTYRNTDSRHFLFS